MGLGWREDLPPLRHSCGIVTVINNKTASEIRRLGQNYEWR